MLLISIICQIYYKCAVTDSNTFFDSHPVSQWKRIAKDQEILFGRWTKQCTAVILSGVSLVGWYCWSFKTCTGLYVFVFISHIIDQRKGNFTHLHYLAVFCRCLKHHFLRSFCLKLVHFCFTFCCCGWTHMVPHGSYPSTVELYLRPVLFTYQDSNNGTSIEKCYRTCRH